MRTRMMAGALAALTLAVGLSACSTGTNDTKSNTAKPESSISQAQNSQSSTMRSGSFEGLNGKKVAGRVSISGDQLKLSGFSSDEGPDLHVYLTNGTDEQAVSAGKVIDKVSYNTADQGFSLTGVDVAKYTNVVVHCDKAKAVFGAAKLS